DTEVSNIVRAIEPSYSGGSFRIPPASRICSSIEASASSGTTATASVIESEIGVGSFGKCLFAMVVSLSVSCAPLTEKRPLPHPGTRAALQIRVPSLRTLPNRPYPPNRSTWENLGAPEARCLPAQSEPPHGRDRDAHRKSAASKKWTRGTHRRG